MESFDFVQMWESALPSPGPPVSNFPVFSHESGKYELETGSPMTARSAIIDRK
jgi:hypothetical protein